MDTGISAAGVLRRVQDAAIQRALLDEADSDRHLAFVGALETVRRDAAERDVEGLVVPLLASTASARADGAVAGAAAAWSPSPDRDADRVGGAILAYRRFDLDVDRAARLAGRSRADFESLLERRDS